MKFNIFTPVRTGLFMKLIFSILLLFNVVTAAPNVLKVGTWEGWHEENFVKTIFPDFTKKTGIKIQSVPLPTSALFLKMISENIATTRPLVDVGMMTPVDALKGVSKNYWQTINADSLKNLSAIRKDMVFKDSANKIQGIGALMWYTTVATNKEDYSKPVKSWKVFWDKDKSKKLGSIYFLEANFFLDIAAKIYFSDRPDILNNKNGILEVMKKVSEIDKNTLVWFDNELQFTELLEKKIINVGNSYHDLITAEALFNKKPFVSHFPKEGAISDFGVWVMPRNSKMSDNALKFIDYMSQPEIQAKLSNILGTTPTVKTSLVRKYFTDDEWSAVSSDHKAIVPNYKMYVKFGKFITEKWDKLMSEKRVSKSFDDIIDSFDEDSD